MTRGEFGHCVNVGSDASPLLLNRYVTNWTLPRPESFLVDHSIVRAWVMCSASFARAIE
jgi:hypothetical protein